MRNIFGNYFGKGYYEGQICFLKKEKIKKCNDHIYVFSLVHNKNHSEYSGLDKGIGHVCKVGTLELLNSV